MTKARVVLIAELDIAKPSVFISSVVQARLDSFRDRVLPSQHYGIVFFRATKADLDMFKDVGGPGYPNVLVMPDEEEQPSSGHWVEDSRFPSADWRYEVTNNDTRLGYREWCQSRAEQTKEVSDGE